MRKTDTFDMKKQGENLHEIMGKCKFANRKRDC